MQILDNINNKLRDDLSVDRENNMAIQKKQSRKRSVSAKTEMC